MLSKLSLHARIANTPGFTLEVLHVLELAVPRLCYMKRRLGRSRLGRSPQQAAALDEFLTIND